MYSKKSQSELIENKDYNMVLLLPHNATKIKYFSKSFSIRFFLLVIKEYYVFLKVAANGLQLQEVGDFGDENCLPALNLIRSTRLHLNTETAFSPNACACCTTQIYK